MLALPIANGLFISVGYTGGAIGAVPAVAICVVLAVVALCQNKLFAEMAAMFADKAGGVAMSRRKGGSATSRRSRRSPRSDTGVAGHSCCHRSDSRSAI
jgi:hypothetical protein